MIRITSNDSVHNCEGASRREFLRVGALGLGGLTLPQLLATRAMAGEGDNILTGKSVVMLNLQGGPTHIETFDPKMSAPNEYRAMFGETKTSLPGVTFGSHFPMLGKLAHKMAVVRSFAHGNGSHASAAALVAAPETEPFALRRRAGESLEDAQRRWDCLLYTSPSPRDLSTSRMPSSA